MTLEPTVDRLADLRDFAANRSVRITPQTSLLIAKRGFQAFVDELAIPVSYTSGNVAVHDVCLFLFDETGAVARRYQYYLWDIDAIVEDIMLLHKESTRQKAAKL